MMRAITSGRDPYTIGNKEHGVVASSRPLPKQKRYIMIIGDRPCPKLH